MDSFSNKALWRALLFSGGLHLVALTWVLERLPAAPEIPLARVQVRIEPPAHARERSVPREKEKSAPAAPKVPERPARVQVPERPVPTVQALSPVPSKENQLLEPRRQESAGSAEKQGGAIPSGTVASAQATGQRPVPVGEGAGADELRQYRLTLAQAARRFKRYPPLARERGWEGTVTVTLVLRPLAAQPDVSLSRSSGWSMLDEQAQEMLRRAIGATALPEPLARRGFSIELPVRFSLDED